jgi:voltage-gated sodium channel
MKRTDRSDYTEIGHQASATPEPLQVEDLPSDHPRRRVHNILEHPTTQTLIITLIILMAVSLGLQTSSSVRERWGYLLQLFDDAILFCFFIEILCRYYVLRCPRFLRDPWNWFDVVILVLSGVPTVLRILGIDAYRDSAAFRIFRIIRLLRYF